MCGGIIEIIPCSIVGHVTLRKAVSSRSEFGRNSARTALTWLDDYARHYFVRNYQSRDISVESVNERKEIRKKLKCKSFEWFLKNVYPELIVPEDRDGFYGALRNQGLTSLVRTNLRSFRCSIIILFYPLQTLYSTRPSDQHTRATPFQPPKCVSSTKNLHISDFYGLFLLYR